MAGEDPVPRLPITVNSVNWRGVDANPKSMKHIMSMKRDTRARFRSNEGEWCSFGEDSS